MTLLLWALAGVCLLVLLRRDEAQAEAKVAAAVARADSAVHAYDSAKTVAVRAQYAGKEASKRERRGHDLLATRLVQVQDSIAVLTQTLRDSGATTEQLRDALAQAIHQADTLTFQASSYLAAVDSLRAQYAIERRAMTVALEKADSALAHQDAAIRAFQKRAECRILGVRCPSRTAVLVTGLVAGAISIPLLTK